MAVSNVVQQLWNKLMKKVGFEQVLKKVTLTQAADGVCSAEMTVDEEHTNSLHTLHGGLTSTLVDTISGMALATKTKDGTIGVSVDLHVTFLKGIHLGEQIVIEAKTNKCGRTLAFLDVNIFNKRTGDLIAKVETKRKRTLRYRSMRNKRAKRTEEQIQRYELRSKPRQSTVKRRRKNDKQRQQCKRR